MPQYVSAAAPAPKRKMSRGKKAAVIGGSVLAGLFLIGIAGGGTGTPAAAPVLTATSGPSIAVLATETAPQAGISTEPVETAATEPVEEDTAEPVEEETAEPADERSIAQQNAVEKAADYLSFAAFSRSGLIKQLKFEGFSTKDATVGVDAQNADWNAQAAKKAADYLEMSSFSRSGLIKQLTFEGFTSAQASHGARKAGL